jgi:hypothetical protein
MKLLVSAIALSVFGIGAALAQPLTATDEERIRQVVPEANLTNLTEEQSSRLAAFAGQGDIDRIPGAAEHIRAILSGQAAMDAEQTALTAVEAERVTVLVPDADLTQLTSEQVRMLSSFVNSSQYERRPAAEAYITAVLAGELSMTPEAPDTLSTSDAERVRFLIPDANLTGLTEDQVERISAFVNRPDYGRNPNDVEFLRSLLEG